VQNVVPKVCHFKIPIADKYYGPTGKMYDLKKKRETKIAPRKEEKL
jgi:hypothetical protein